MKNQPIVVGMSGGVDSSVAALLLKQQGYQVSGLFMKNWEEDDDASYCAAAEDLKEAQQVCDKLDIPLHKINFAAEYWDKVFENFLEEYQQGRTPNPDILCNKYIKFTAFLDHAKQLGAQQIATGHYAQKKITDTFDYLLKGEDPNKDQSYFLYALNQQQLRHTLFPVGHLKKPLVRELAKEAGFPNYRKKDSTGICFIGERKFKDFLSRYLPAQPGNIVTTDGKIIGQHQGLMYYTLGQRQGIGIGGKKNAEESPWYVAKKNMSTKELIVVQGHEHPLLFSKGFICQSIHWIADTPNLPYRCKAKIRYRQEEQACRIELLNEGMHLIQFDEPQWAVTPGQSAVFYQDNTCLGGAIIESHSQ